MERNWKIEEKNDEIVDDLAFLSKMQENINQILNVPPISDIYEVIFSVI